jgi:hypothetical protein
MLLSSIAEYLFNGLNSMFKVYGLWEFYRSQVQIESSFLCYCLL